MIPYLETILQKVQSGELLNWSEVENFIEFNSSISSDWDQFFTEISKHFQLDPKKEVFVYIPGRNFPSISVTGTECELNCKHCNKKYLNNMLEGNTSEKLKNVLERCIDRECNGALISGGSTTDGKVPLLNFAETIKTFKENHPKFKLNSHVGLVDYNEAMQLKQIGIDVVSFDLVLDNGIIKEIFRMNKNKKDYIKSYNSLQNAGLNVVPHILVGGYYGKLRNEWKNIKFIKESLDSNNSLQSNRKMTIVIIAMIPPKLKMNEKNSSEFSEPSPIDVAKIILLTKFMLKDYDVELSLGCMHPRSNNESRFLMEKYSIMAGATHIAMPSQKTLRWLKDNNYMVKTFNTCCSIPNI